MVLWASFLSSSPSTCFPLELLVVVVGLACVNAALAAVAFTQLFRIHVRNQQVGWTRQKVLHLMIGSSTLGYVLYLMSTLIATCEGWLCWSNACGFILMACPKILFLAAFLLLLSFWVDLCHQANDDEDDEEERSTQQSLLHNSQHKPGSLEKDVHRKCCSFQGLNVGSRQKFVIVVVVFIFILMTAFAVIIWIGVGKNPINSAVVARVYVDLFASTILLLGGALGCYGLLLCLKLRKVRSERSSSEIWKVAGLAVVSISCFTSSALVALLTDIPLFYHWHLKKVTGSEESVLLILYYFIGSSVPSAFVLWVMRELPPPIKTTSQQETGAITFVSSGTGETHHPQRWTVATSSSNPVSRASPI